MESISKYPRPSAAQMKSAKVAKSERNQMQKKCEWMKRAERIKTFPCDRKKLFESHSGNESDRWEVQFRVKDASICRNLSLASKQRADATKTKPRKCY